MKRVFVIVGTTSFDDLFERVTSPEAVQVLKARDYQHLVLQVGRSSIFPDSDSCHKLMLEAFKFTDSTAEDVKWEGSCLETLGAGKPLLVVFNGKLMDIHQLELTRQLHQDLLYFTARLLIIARDSGSSSSCVMFICIKHGDNEQFLANTNCPVVLLLQYLRAKMGLPETELVDLCDDRGALKLLFLSQQPQECASRLLPPRCSLTFCIVNRNPKDGAYISITPLVANPDPAFLETLQTQTDSLERARLRQLRSQEDRRATEAPSQTQPTQTAKGRGRAVHMDTPDDEPSNRRTGGRRSRN